MKISNIVAAMALAFCASQASAVPFVTAAASVPATPFSYSPFTVGGTIASTTGFTTVTGSAPFSSLEPGYGGGSYSVVSSISNLNANTTGTLTFGTVLSSFTFLWGSPDVGNVLTVNGIDFSGATVFGASHSVGNNDDTRYVTVTDTAGFTSLTFTASNVAFEVAQVTPVPEPETYALMLAGLGAIGWIARRRKSV